MFHRSTADATYHSSGILHGGTLARTHGLAWHRRFVHCTADPRTISGDRMQKGHVFGLRGLSFFVVVITYLSREFMLARSIHAQQRDGHPEARPH